MIRRLGLILSLAGFAACDVTGPSGPHAQEQVRLSLARAQWGLQGLSDYTYVYTRSCFCAPESREPATVTVRFGSISSVVTASGLPRNPAAYQTVEGLFDFVQDAISKDAATIRVEYDPGRGYPTSAYFDLDARIADEEFSIEAKALTPLR